MKSLFTLSLTAGLLLAAGCASQPEPIPPPRADLKLIWNDEFEGTALDPLKWERIPAPGENPSAWRKYTSLRPDLVEVKDGDLILHGVANDDLKADPRPYLQGQVWTRNLFSYFYGLIEIRAKFEDQKGAWPAFWLLPDGLSWENGGEIDIMERLNSDPFVYQTCHCKWSLVLKKKVPRSGGKGDIDPGEYNVYGLEWTPDELIWSVNGKETFRYPRTGEAPEQWPFSQGPFYLLLDMQLEGAWVGPVDPSTLPVATYIDYVRVWQRK